MIRSLVPVCALLLAAPAAPQGLPGPCWESNVGTNLFLGDDSVSPALPLGFAFPLPGGGTTREIEVSSNGFLYLVTGSGNGSGCCNGNAVDFLSGPPRIAAAWSDLNPGAAGGVYFDTRPDRAVITWDQVPEYSVQPQNCVQVQLFPDGSFSIAIPEMTRPGSHDVLVGVTPGLGATDPGEVDFTASASARTWNDPTLYELFDFPDEPRDIAGRTYYFRPAGSTGWTFAEQRRCSSASWQAFGTGCPLRGPVAYEWFEARGSADFPDLATDTGVTFTRNADGSYTTGLCRTGCFESDFVGQDLGLHDDAVSQPLPLGFTQDIAGVPGVSHIVVASNGWIHVDPTATDNRCCGGSIQELLDGPPGLAPYWTDLNPSIGGTVWFRALPDRAVVTWDRVPEYGSGAAGPQTFQAQLFANGDITFAYLDVSIALHDVLVGLSVGEGADDPGEIDLSSGRPFTTGRSGRPTSLAPFPDHQPQIGSTFLLEVGSIPSGSLEGVLSFGATNPGLDLSSIGAPGCWLYSSSEETLCFATPSPSVRIPLAVPYDQALVGLDLIVQAALLTPGVNDLGVVTTNGGSIRVGL